MEQTIQAVFDGDVFRPLTPPMLKPNTRVQMIIEAVLPVPDASASFLQTARALDLPGPADWSENLEAYLYAREPDAE